MRLAPQKNKIKKNFLGLFLSLSLILNVFLISVPFYAQTDTNQKLQYVFQYLLQYLQKHYVNKITETELWEGAIKGLLLATNDPYTRYLKPEEFREFSSIEEAKKVGLGIEISTTKNIILESQDWEKYPYILSVFRGSPADAAGIQSGDILLEVNHKSTANLNTEQLSLLLTGELDSRVRLVVKKKGSLENKKFELIRKPFDLEYVYAHYFSEFKIGYIRLSHFLGEKSGSVESFNKKLGDILHAGANSLILDLRNNTGGHLEMAIELSSLFLKPNQILFSIRGREDKEKNTKSNKIIYASEAQLIQEEKEGTKIEPQKFTKNSYLEKVPEKIKIIVLINEGTASAAEIMAAALRDNKRALLLGSKSFGKGSIQIALRDLPNAAATMVTVQHYYTPKGENIHKLGLKPDIEVKEVVFNSIDYYFLDKLEKKNFWTNVSKENLILKLKARAKFWEWDLDEAKLNYIIYQKTRKSFSKIPMPELDLQFKRALEILRNKVN